MGNTVEMAGVDINCSKPSSFKRQKNEEKKQFCLVTAINKTSVIDPKRHKLAIKVQVLCYDKYIYLLTSHKYFITTFCLK